MKRLLIAACALALAGCGTTGQQVLTNLQGCERHYDGVVAAGFGAGFSGTVKIDCPAATPPAAPLKPAPAN